jgi:hypothetical protein
MYGTIHTAERATYHNIYIYIYTLIVLFCFACSRLCNALTFRKGNYTTYVISSEPYMVYVIVYHMGIPFLGSVASGDTQTQHNVQ